MGVTVRAYRRGWQVDVAILMADGSRYRERRRLRIGSKSAAVRWGQDRERHVLRYGLPQAEEGGAHLERVRAALRGRTRARESTEAERDRGEGSAAARPPHPDAGPETLDGITNEDVQRLKCAMQAKSPKTVNNALAVLSVLLKKAIEWDVIDRMPCTIRLLRGSKPEPRFHDFDQYERLVEVAARSRSGSTSDRAPGRRGGPAVWRDDRARVDRRGPREAPSLGPTLGLERADHDAERRAGPVRAAHRAIDVGVTRASAPAQLACALSAGRDSRSRGNRCSTG